MPVSFVIRSLVIEDGFDYLSHFSSDHKYVRMHFLAGKFLILEIRMMSFGMLVQREFLSGWK